MGGPGAVHRRPPRQGAAHARRLLPVGCGAPRRPGRGLRPPHQARQAPRGDAEGDHHPQRHGDAAQRVHAAQPGARRAQRHRPRLGPPLRERPGDGFFADFARAADDESRHFRWYSQRFAELGFSYGGDMPVHNLLWRECARSSSDVSARLAVIPLVQGAELSLACGVQIDYRSWLPRNETKSVSGRLGSQMTLGSMLGLKICGLSTSSSHPNNCASQNKLKVKANSNGGNGQGRSYEPY